MNSAMEQLAIALWVDYVQSASPPVIWYKDDNLKHWQETATQRDREAWRRVAGVAIDKVNQICDDVGGRILLPPDWRKLIYERSEKIRG